MEKSYKEWLRLLQFEKDGNKYTKYYDKCEKTLVVDSTGKGFIYYQGIGITVGRNTITDLDGLENLVELQCIDSLLKKGYQPEHIELEPKWKLGDKNKGGFADVWIRTPKNTDKGNEMSHDSLIIIECKKRSDFDNAWTDTKKDGGQLFTYFQQEPSTKFLCLYTAEIVDGVIEPLYQLINVQDNQDLLNNDETALSYNNKTNKERYNVWKSTYKFDSQTKGVFEDDILPYLIGKEKYNTKDLETVKNATIKKKYNDFALILRRYNVGTHENAFDKLVNLFLAKVVDECNNPNDLQFHWKGNSYDNSYFLQDRLQKLYRDGMKKFLNEEVTYIDNSEIEKAFRRFKEDPDATKKKIMGYFRELKFFSDNDFSFISVHNKDLFDKNAEILLEVVKMLQDIDLKGSEHNQLLGDLFEGFLTKGVKQSEGQFFTPMPIVRFIVSSLPLETVCKKLGRVPNAIDYACGAGHFLTEYSNQLTQLIAQEKVELSRKEIFAHTTGIEKEYRLSKVSKVSAFMYGHDETKIMYADALTDKVGNESYDILIANPPYSVKGFLETIDEKDRRKFTLYNESINIDKNNAIETFFIERASQLLVSEAVAAIILPESVLTKSGIYSRSREILLKQFDLVAMVLLGSGTFGKTGTHTVTLFLRRKETNVPDSEHYYNRVESWFNSNHEGDTIYQDLDLLLDYIEYCEYEKEDYMSFLAGNISDKLLSHQTFKMYSKYFWSNDKNAMAGVPEKAKDIRTKVRASLKNKKLSLSERKERGDIGFLNYVIAIEKEKLYYFILAKKVNRPVVVVTSPTSTTQIQKFLGYKWSDSKGNEGINYLHVKKAKAEDGDAEDDDTMQQIEGIKGIVTPLFNPNNLFDESKINTIIRRNFESIDFEIDDELTEFVSSYNLVDLIDFRSNSFTKAIKTQPSYTYPQIESKYESEDLGDVAPYIKDKVPFGEISLSSYVTTANMLQNRGGITSYQDVPEIDKVTRYKKGDILISNIRPYLKKIWFADIDGGCSPDILVFRNIKPDNYLADYLKEILSSNIFFDYMMVGTTGMKMPRGDKKMIPYFKIPKAPHDIQKKIVDECSVEENIFKKALKKSISLKQNIERIYQEGHSKAYDTYSLNDTELFSVSIGRRVLKSELDNHGTYRVYSANVNNIFGMTDFSILNDFSMPSVLWGIDGDWMVSYLAKDIPFNPTDHCGVIRVLREDLVIPKYLVYSLSKSGEAEHFSRTNRASTERIKMLRIKVPVYEIQKKVVDETSILETELSKLYDIMDNSILNKEKILMKYLKISTQ